MTETIYVESAVVDHPRAKHIVSKYARARIVECEHYGEIFNRAGQNFRAQKQTPGLILANKTGRRVYPAPNDHAIGAPHNYYFSHMLNCPFDCRYCFLQGKFNSANYVLFVNYEDFLDEIIEVDKQHEDEVHIFAGYDCDSLAFEPITGFSEWMIENLTPATGYLVELRTKSAQIRKLLRTAPNPSCLIAYSLAPQIVVSNIEHGTASLADRLRALRELQNAGWQIGLRLDPLIEFESCARVYAEFFEQISQCISLKNVHSITLGTMRFPQSYFKKLVKLYPEEPLFAKMVPSESGNIGYREELTNGLLRQAYDHFASQVDPERVFVHHQGDF